MKLWQRLKKSVIPAIIIYSLIAFGAVRVLEAHDYSLYGKGNCVYFAADMMEMYWPVNVHIPRSYDAGEWTKLAEQDGVVETDRPRCGDFIVWPKTDTDRYGHVAFIIGVSEWMQPDLEAGTIKQGTAYTVWESNMYANDVTYRYRWNRCQYRRHVYTQAETFGCCFLTHE